MWIFKNSSAAQILREITITKLKESEQGHFENDCSCNFLILKIACVHQNQNSKPLISFFEVVMLPKLISHKICMSEKFLHFQTV